MIHRRETRIGRIDIPKRSTAVAHKGPWNRKAVTIGAKVVRASSQSHVREEVCTCAEKATMSPGMLIDFGDPMNPVMVCIEHVLTRMLVHFRIAALKYSSALLHGIVTGSEVSPRLPWLPDEISVEFLMLERLDSINQVFMDCASKDDSSIEALMKRYGQR